VRSQRRWLRSRGLRKHKATMPNEGQQRMRKAAHRVSLEAGDTLRQGGALGDSEVVNLLVGTIRSYEHIISSELRTAISIAM
jgi:hypothetical protein